MNKVTVTVHDPGFFIAQLFAHCWANVVDIGIDGTPVNMEYVRRVKKLAREALLVPADDRARLDAIIAELRQHPVAELLIIELETGVKNRVNMESYDNVRVDFFPGGFAVVTFWRFGEERYMVSIRLNNLLMEGDVFAEAPERIEFWHV